MGAWLWAVLAGCGGEPARQPGPESAPRPDLPVAATWPVRGVAEGWFAELAARPAWRAMLEHRLVDALGTGDGEVVPRVHADLAIVYREAALLAARALEGTYGPSHIRPTDPPGVHALLGIAYAVSGQLDAARAELDALPPGLEPAGLAELAGRWRAALAAAEDPSGYLLLSASGAPWAPPWPVVPGRLPQPPAAPQFALPEEASGRLVEHGDPTVLLQLAFWHEAAAREAADPARVDAWLAPWRLPSEPTSRVEVAPVRSRDLFLTAFLEPGDLRGDEDTAVGRSLAACDAAPEVPDCILEAGVAMQDAVRDGLAEAAGGPAPDHRLLAGLARVAVVRAGVRRLEASGDREGGGRLRLEALDLATGPAGDPGWLLAQAAWDAGNRNPLRAQQLLHAWLGRLPGLETARYALDALHLRVGREAGPALPQF